MEMAQNAIEWGNLHQSDRLVSITYRVHDDRLEIVVRDQGPGFDRTSMPHAAIAGDPFTHLDVREKLGLRAGGFGLLICQGMVDEMRYNDQGNEVTLIKRFGSRTPSRQEWRSSSYNGTGSYDDIEVMLDHPVDLWNVDRRSISTGESGARCGATARNGRRCRLLSSRRADRLRAKARSIRLAAPEGQTGAGGRRR